MSATDANLGNGGSGSGLSIEVDGIYQPQASGAAYYVVATGTDADGNEWMEVSTTSAGTPITLAKDGAPAQPTMSSPLTSTSASPTGTQSAESVNFHWTSAATSSM